MRFALILASVVLVLASGSALTARADSWRLPTKEKYYSPNKKFCFEVTPKQLESQLSYFEDKVEGREDAGGRKDVKDNVAKGTFSYRGSDGKYHRLWQFPLVNEVSPVSAIVSDRGDYVVAFDNWHSVGYGDDVITIYSVNGTVVKKFGLEDLLTEGDIYNFSRSTSSRSWGGEHYFDAANGLLVLKVISNRMSPWDPGVKFHELKIQLATGQPLEPKRDLFPQTHYLTKVIEIGPPDANFPNPSPFKCSAEGEGIDAATATKITSNELIARIKEAPAPVYPSVAQAAHATGAVNVEVLILPTGEVACVRTLSGHPMLRGVVVAAVTKWRFAPVGTAGPATPLIGSFAIEFSVQDY